MTKSTITRERLEQLADNNTICKVSWDERLELARIALAAMNGEPVAEVGADYALRYISHGPAPKEGLSPGDKLYLHAQPSTVVLDDEKLRALFDVWFASDCSFDLSPEASEADNIAWRESYWYVWQRCRAAMLQAGNCRENANSSTNNFREITETSTSTAITPAAPDKKLTDDVLDGIIAEAKTSMEQYLALSLKAEREAWRQGEPTDDERIMAIEGINNCERCGDEGWIIGEMGITRCACSQDGTLTSEDTKQFEPVTTANKLPDDFDFDRFNDVTWLECVASNPHMHSPTTSAIARVALELNKRIGAGNSPVIPDGYVMVPKEPTAEMISSGIAAHYDRSQIQIHDRPAPGPMECAYVAMLATAPQEVSHD